MSEKDLFLSETVWFMGVGFYDAEPTPCPNAAGWATRAT
jgi:hypothetical protein